MVQNTRTSIAWQIALRMIFLIAIIIVGIFIYDPFSSFVTNTLHYRESPGFFDSLGGLETAFLGLFLFYLLAISIVFGGFFGKKGDYIFIGIIFILLGLLFAQEKGATPEMYLGLIGVAALGNALGYILKLARVNWFGIKI